MIDPLEILNNQINIDTEMLSVLPKNNKKNKGIYVEKVNEVRQEYIEYQKLLVVEMKRREKKISLIRQNNKISEIENKLSNVTKLDILNEFNTSYEKMGLDEKLFILRRFYKNNLEEVNNSIAEAISMFHDVGVELTIDDFKYSSFVHEYMSVFFEELKNRDINSQRIKDVFEKIYWKSSDIIIHIEMNFKYLYLKNEKTIDKYFTQKKEELLETLQATKKEILKKYEELQRQLIELKNSDTKIILNKFLDKTFEVKDFEPSSINKQYAKILFEPLENYNEESLEELNQNILKLENSLYEYENYLKFEFILKRVQEIYKEKDKYKNVYLAQLKDITKAEKKLMQTNAKIDNMSRHTTGLFGKGNITKIEKTQVYVNSQILAIKDMYRKLDEDRVYNKIAENITDNSTIYDILYFASSFYSFLVEVIINNFEDIPQNEISKKIKDLREFIQFPYITIINNMKLEQEKDIILFIKDKYNLYNLNITKEDLAEENLPTLIVRIRQIVNAYNLKSSKIELEDIKFMLKAKRILEELKKTV